LSTKGVQGILHVFPTVLDYFTGDPGQPVLEDAGQTLVIEIAKRS
jgi:hypothetical protein